MRWKPMFIAALVSGSVGTGLTFALVRAFSDHANPLGAYTSVAFDFVALGALSLLFTWKLANRRIRKLWLPEAHFFTYHVRNISRILRRAFLCSKR